LVFASMHDERLALDLAGFSIFKNMTAIARNRFQERAEIFQWMKLGLMQKAHSRLPRVRNFLHELGFKTKFARQLRILLKGFMIFLISIVEGRMQISRNPLEITVNVSLANDLFNLIDRHQACFPKSFRGVA